MSAAAHDHRFDSLPLTLEGVDGFISVTNEEILEDINRTHPLLVERAGLRLQNLKLKRLAAMQTEAMSEILDTEAEIYEPDRTTQD